jgi:dTDP-4-dehydrorhamnose reductase
MVRTLHAEHFIVRTGYLFGGGTDHLSLAAKKLARGEPAGAIADRIATPTYVPHLADTFVPLALSGRFGTYHVAGSEVLSRFDVLARLRFAAGYAVSVERQESASLGLAAARPRNSALVSLFAHDVGVMPLPPLEVAIKEMLDGD